MVSTVDVACMARSISCGKILRTTKRGQEYGMVRLIYLTTGIEVAIKAARFTHPHQLCGWLGYIWLAATVTNLMKEEQRRPASPAP